MPWGPAVAAVWMPYNHRVRAGAPLPSRIFSAFEISPAPLKPVHTNTCFKFAD